MTEPAADRLEELKVHSLVYGGCAFVALIGWLVVCTLVGFLSVPRPNPQVLRYAKAYLDSGATATLGIDAADPGTYRVEPRAVGNVRVYVPKAVWERIPYPDRDAAGAAVGKAWCGALPLQVKMFFPRVTIRDIRSGEDLAHYSCFVPHW